MAANYEQPLWTQPPSHPGIKLPPLKIYNSLTRSKNSFIPKDPTGRKLTWYACGPTVYDDAHLGHARNYVSTDIIRRIMRDYFHFDVTFVMNITDVDDKIIVRARQQHLFAEYVAKHPNVTGDVVTTARLAFSTYLKQKLPLVDPEVHPSGFQKEAEKAYASILSGGVLEGNKKPGSDEAKIKMNIKSASLSGRLIGEALEKIEKVADADTSKPGEGSDVLYPTPESVEAFYAACEDVFHAYLDELLRSSIPDDDHSIFTKLTRHYEARFMEDMRNLNVLDPDKVTRVMEYGPEIVNFVEKIVEKEFGYKTPDGSVYFDINAFKHAGNHFVGLEPWSGDETSLQNEGEGSLTKHSTAKRSKNDFALWKSSRPGEPSWPSPWGKGRPGWHIECSAMASAELGSQMDIHSGGIDLSFPHHHNELVQSEAYWSGEHQWVNYFLHMGHLSIQGAKMSKSLKNFTTIREALDRGTWSSRSLRIVFLLGAWREGIEITEDMVKASHSWEEKLNNYFLKAKNFLASKGAPSQEGSRGADGSLADSLKLAQEKVFDALCDSFDTPTAMAAISELISSANSAEGWGLDSSIVERIAKWVTSMVNIFGLNGTASPDSPGIGWEGIDIPEYARPYLNSLSMARDSLRQLTKSKDPISHDLLRGTFAPYFDNEQPPPDIARPYADVLASFRNNVMSIGLDDSEGISKELLALCDRVRDVDLFDLGVYLEDRENRPALVRPVTRDLVEARERQAEQRLQKERLKREKLQREQEKLEKGKLSPLEMFKTGEFSAWDEYGLPIKDHSGNDIAKSRSKKLRKDWERQKRLHGPWLGSNSKKN